MTGYKDFGFTNDKPTYSFHYLKVPILSMLDKEKNQCILDIGCGNGYWVNYLISLGYNAYGIDPSEKGIAIAASKNPGRFFLQDLSTGKLPGGLAGLKIDTIISTEVIEHLYDPEDFIRLYGQVLENNGEIIISTPYHGYLKNLLLSILNKWDNHLEPKRVGGHIKFWSVVTLGSLLNNAGFKVIDFKGCGRIPYFWKSMIIKAKLS